MRKIGITMLAVIVLVLTCAASCDKEGHKTSRTFKATAEWLEDDAVTSPNGSPLLWNAGDSIKVYDNAGHCGNYTLHSGAGTSNGTFDYSSGKEAGDGPYRAVYPARFFTGKNEVTLPRVQRTANGNLKELPMYAMGESSELELYNICGVVRFRLTAQGSVSLRRIAVTTNVATNGAAIISGSGPTIAISTPNGTTTTTLMCDTAQNIASAHDFYMYLPAGNYSNFSIRITADDWSSCTKRVSGTISVQRGKTSTITLTNLNFEEPQALLPGEFTVDAYGRTVRFSQGNLQYIGSTDKPYWKFAEHQYDYIGATGQGTGRPNVDRDLFAWGTSGWDNGNYFYKPYNISHPTKDPYTSDNGFGYGPTNGLTCTYSLTGAYANADWGVYNAIKNGGNTAGMWRTLTYDEWNYLLKVRANASSKIGYATVAGVHGMILLPDNFTDPMKNNGSKAFVSRTSTGWKANVYTADNWTAMELAGAVFLPAAGGRYGSTINRVGSYGLYWTSSYNGNYYAKYVFFDKGSLSMGSNYRHSGRSVRLIQD